MISDGYKTPEGFILHRPLLLPDVRDFAEVCEYVREWDHEHMTTSSNTELVVHPRYVPEETPAANEWESRTWHTAHGWIAVGPFCSVDLSQLGGLRRSIAVRATDAVLEAVGSRIATPTRSLSFKVIGHAGTKRALVILDHGYIIGSHYLAYVDPTTLPAYPFEARDASRRMIAEEIKAAGHDVMQRRSREPYEIVLQGFTRGAAGGWQNVYNVYHGEPITIKADGTVIR